jgi:membrane fusion protein, multidrug efflux system
MTSLTKKLIIAGIVLFVALVVLRAGRVARGRERGAASSGTAPVPVTVASVEQKSVPIEFRTFGTVQPIMSAAIKSQIGGILTDVHVQEGQDVKKGDLLFTVDPRPQQASVKQAEANLARDTVQYNNAKKEAARQEDLLGKGMAAEDAYDQAKATAESLAAVLQADEAAVANARLQLEYCQIRAPFDGRAGEIGVDQGNVVKANDVTLLTLNQIQPIEVSFSLPQQDLPDIVTERAKGALKVQAYAPGNDGHAETGELAFVDNQVDRTTGTIRLKGTFVNSDQRLWPGQFVNVVLTVAIQPDAIVVPTAAVQTGQKGPYVFVVQPDLTVQDRAITVSRALDGESVVSDGLRAGERVVTDGQLRLRPGARIEVKPARGSASANGS